MDMFVVGFEQACDRVLCQPVHFQVRMALSQLARDGDVATAMAEADRGRKIESALLACRAWRRRTRGRGNAQPPIDKIVDQGVRLRWIAPERVMSAAFDRDEFRAAYLGVGGLRARVRLDLVVVAVDEQDRAAYL